MLALIYKQVPNKGVMLGLYWKMPLNSCKDLKPFAKNVVPMYGWK